jgi:hypothetical protein
MVSVRRRENGREKARRSFRQMVVLADTCS